MTPETFYLVLRALPDRVDASDRLKAFLKRAKRDWGLICERCTSSPPISEADQQSDGATRHDETDRKQLPRVHKRSLLEAFENFQNQNQKDK